MTCVQLPHDVRGQESVAHADSGYTGLDRREKITQAQEDGRLREGIDWHISMKRRQL